MIHVSTKLYSFLQYFYIEIMSIDKLRFHNSVVWPLNNPTCPDVKKKKKKKYNCSYDGAPYFVLYYVSLSMSLIWWQFYQQCLTRALNRHNIAIQYSTNLWDENEIKKRMHVMWQLQKRKS